MQSKWNLFAVNFHTALAVLSEIIIIKKVKKKNNTRSGNEYIENSI